MAQGKIIVETEKLDSTASKVRSLAEEYQSEYNRLYNIMKEMKNVFDGEDSVTIINQIEGFRNGFEAMKQLLEEDAAFLHKTASTYRQTQDDIAARAKQLSQGN